MGVVDALFMTAQVLRTTGESSASSPSELIGSSSPSFSPSELEDNARFSPARLLPGELSGLGSDMVEHSCDILTEVLKEGARTGVAGYRRLGSA